MQMHRPGRRSIVLRLENHQKFFILALFDMALLNDFTLDT